MFIPRRRRVGSGASPRPHVLGTEIGLRQRNSLNLVPLGAPEFCAVEGCSRTLPPLMSFSIAATLSIKVIIGRSLYPGHGIAAFRWQCLCPALAQHPDSLHCANGSELKTDGHMKVTFKI